MFGVYIHFPYCRKRCPYCDFATHARERIPHDAYADAVVAELEARAPLYEARAPRGITEGAAAATTAAFAAFDRRAVSIYFGGGTPGLWRADCVGRVLTQVRERLDVSTDAEVTLEANPGELPKEQLAALRAAGINRLSLGVQSLEPRHLITLGRLHGAKEPIEAVANARACGFDNLSLDLMFGLPGQTMAELDRDLDQMLALEPDHLSIYNLTVEERTPFGAMQREGTLRLPDSGLVTDMFERVGARLAQGGYEHYEISNYARPGRRAVHNTLYWRQGEYLGLGSSAHSHRRVRSGAGFGPGSGDDRSGYGERFSTVRSVDDYLSAIPLLAASARAELKDDPAIAMYERLDETALEREAMWLGLRLLEGVSRAAHVARFGVDPTERHHAVVAKLVADGLLEVGDHLRLTKRGVLFADEVGARFM